MSPPVIKLYLDYSSGTIPGAAIKAAGYQGAVRYITAPDRMNPPGKNQKHMTRAEYLDHQANGLDTVFIFQGSTTDADSGFAGGVANARLALAGMQYLGAPVTTPTFFTNDRPTLPSPSAWQDYLRGAQSVLGSVGQYGFRNAIDAGWGIAYWSWQCGSESQLRPGVSMYQWNNGSATVGGRTCDINRVYLPILTKDNDVELNDPVNLVSPVTPTYSETHSVKDVFSANWFYGADVYNMLQGNIESKAIKNLEDKVDAALAATGDPKAMVALAVAEIKQELAPLFDLAERLKN